LLILDQEGKPLTINVFEITTVSMFGLVHLGRISWHFKRVCRRIN